MQVPHERLTTLKCQLVCEAVMILLLDIVQCAHAYERIRECSGIKNRVALEYRVLLVVAGESGKNLLVPSVARNRNWGLVRETSGGKDRGPDENTTYSRYYKDWIGSLVPVRGTCKGDDRL